MSEHFMFQSFSGAAPTGKVNMASPHAYFKSKNFQKMIFNASCVL